MNEKGRYLGWLGGNMVLFTVVFVFVLEMSARIDDKLNYGAPLWKKYNYSVLLEYDKEGIRHNVPNARFEKWIINSHGFRGREIERNKDKSHIRVVCLGASETFGLYESQNQEWPSQLDRFLKESFPLVEAVNAAVVGNGLKKAQKYLEKYVMSLEPDVVILYLSFYEYAVKTVGEEKNESGGIEEKKIKKIGMFKEIYENIRVFPKMKEVIKRIMPEWLINKISIWSLESEIRKIEAIRLRNRQPIDRVSEVGIREFKEDLTGLLNYLRRKNIIPILTTYPVLITEMNRQVYRKILLDSRRFWITLSECGMIDASRRYNEIIEDIARKENVIFVDNQDKIPKTTEYFGDNVHYTNKGAECIALNFYNLFNHSGLIQWSLRRRKSVEGVNIRPDFK